VRAVRLLALACLLGCDVPPDDEPLEGPCDVGQAVCLDRETYQVCEGGRWSEPRACEPLGDDFAALPTYCQSEGQCTP
jgi:hypothetical protein